MATNILMPALSPTMTEGTLARWLKKEGDAVSAGDVIAEIETDKATMEVEAVDEGVLGKILVADGTAGVQVNAPIAILVEQGESVPSAAPAAASPATPAPATADSAPKPSAAGPSMAASMAPAAAPSPAQAAIPTPSAAAAAAPAPAAADGPATAAPAPLPNGHDAQGGRIFASPLAKRMASQAGIALEQVRGTGPNGRIIKADIEAYRAAPAAQPAAVPAGAPAAAPTAPRRRQPPGRW